VQARTKGNAIHVQFRKLTTGLAPKVAERSDLVCLTSSRPKGYDVFGLVKTPKSVSRAKPVVERRAEMPDVVNALVEVGNDL